MYLYAMGHIVIVVNGQRLNSNIAIWSHWQQPNCNHSDIAKEKFDSGGIRTASKSAQ